MLPMGLHPYRCSFTHLLAYSHTKAFLNTVIVPVSSWLSVRGPQHPPRALTSADLLLMPVVPANLLAQINAIQRPTVKSNQEKKRMTNYSMDVGTGHTFGLREA